jgi:CheY-like chemotaxis protein
MSLSCNSSSRSNTAHGHATPPPQSPVHTDARNGTAKVKKPTTDGSPPRTHLTDAQKKDFHILVVEDNAINQQIALKTIRSLGFSVSAVWNGQEALDYLLKATGAAQSANPANTLVSTTTPANSTSLPNLILMDVQMPVRDGYSTCAALRYHAPFKDMQLIQKIPIVAMTASAIQGDREKCMRAGMDDYLAKPVKRTILEKMILKWAEGGASMMPQTRIKARNDSCTESSEGPDIARRGTRHSSNCPGSDCPSPEKRADHAPSTPAPMYATPAPTPLDSVSSQRPHIPSSVSQDKITSLRTAGDPTTTLSEGDRGLRRAAAEEQAANLRDEKLLAASGAVAQIHDGTRSGGGAISGGLGSSSPLLVTSSSVVLPFSSASPQGGESYSDQRANSGNLAALTEANIEKFNADKLDDAGVPTIPLRPSGSTVIDGAEQSRPPSGGSTKALSGDMSAEMSMDLLLGPPTEGAAETAVEKGDPVDDLLLMTPQQQEQQQQEQQQQEGLQGGTGDVETKTREKRLSAQDRRASDWSQSTARP